MYTARGCPSEQRRVREVGGRRLQLVVREPLDGGGGGRRLPTIPSLAAAGSRAACRRPPTAATARSDMAVMDRHVATDESARQERYPISAAAAATARPDPSPPWRARGEGREERGSERAGAGAGPGQRLRVCFWWFWGRLVRVEMKWKERKTARESVCFGRLGAAGFGESGARRGGGEL